MSDRFAGINVHDPVKLADCLSFWCERQAEVDKALARLPRASMSTSGLAARYDRIRRVAQNADEILSFLADMNTLSPEILEESGFSRLKEAILQALSRGAGAIQ